MAGNFLLKRLIFIVRIQMIQSASLIKRFAAGIYELLSLIALWLFFTFVFVILSGGVDSTIERLTLQILLWVVTGLYFVVCWMKTGQTLAAQAWKIKLINIDGGPLSFQQAILRYALATISFFMFGLGFLWALVDQEHLFLHDRLSKTLFIKLKPN
jgi:uncharacterized RDD family membrane protein YckC